MASGTVTRPRYGVGVICLACGRWVPGSMCARCASSLAPAPERVLTDGLLVRAPFAHEAAARTLVRSLKYRGLLDVAGFFAAAMVPLLPTSVTALVPVPRAAARRLRFGVDPAAEIATALGRSTGLPVVNALRAPAWWPRHAGRNRERRREVGFTGRTLVGSSAVLIDDVATTGATLSAARAGLKGLPTLALTATSVGRVVARVYPTHRVREVT